ncbi:MAG: pilus assembly protein [Cohaesibacter sp.]|jgi:Flp pilus assembly pilin Flp|nr:pilus assembly protein [Cohaesibacter sp.]
MGSLSQLVARRLKAPTMASTFSRFLKKDEEGAAAVEFALVFTPFIAFLLLIMTLFHMLWVSHSMETSMRMVSRQIKTGQAQAAGMSRTEFRNAICENVALSEAICRRDLIVDVERYEAFEDINFDPPMRDGNLDPGVADFDPGVGSSIIIVKTYLPMDDMSPVHRLLGGTGTLMLPLSATAAFRNEPFS